MINRRALVLVFWGPVTALAQPTVLEVQGLFGECIPIYAAASDVLTLYETPNLESVQHEVRYGEKWKIPYVKSEGLTRVISFGEIETVATVTLMSCEVQLENSETQLVAGDIATYLYYLGEGIAKVQTKGTVCELDIADARILNYPVVQAWLRVLFRDGSSPGWLLNDGAQTINAGLRC